MGIKEWKGDVVEVVVSDNEPLPEALRFLEAEGYQFSPSVNDGVGVSTHGNSCSWFIPVVTNKQA